MLPDILAPGLRLLVCGTAVGTRSAAMGTYYAGRNNRFWATLHRTGLTPMLLQPSQQVELLHYGIGLTDLVKGQAGMDDRIDFATGLGTVLQETVQRWSPAVVCLNGKRAAREVLGIRAPTFGLHPERFAGVQLFIAPSTSGAANATWDERHWHDLARLVARHLGGV